MLNRAKRVKGREGGGYVKHNAAMQLHNIFTLLLLCVTRCHIESHNYT